MAFPRMTLTLTALNIGLVLVVLMQAVAAGARGDGKVMQAEVWELVDEAGQVRARLNVEESGEVVWRMTDQEGTIRLKMGADIDGSGLVLLDGETEPGVHLLAETSGSKVTLGGKDGKELVLQP